MQLMLFGNTTTVNYMQGNTAFLFVKRKYCGSACWFFFLFFTVNKPIISWGKLTPVLIKGAIHLILQFLQPDSYLLLQNVRVAFSCRPHPGTRKGSEEKPIKTKIKLRILLVLVRFSYSGTETAVNSLRLYQIKTALL